MTPGESAVTQFLRVHAQVMNQAFELLRGRAAARVAGGDNPAVPAGNGQVAVAATEAETAQAMNPVATGSWPLSRIQQEIWLLDQLGSDHSRAYWEGMIVDLHGELDLAAMRSAVAWVLARHDSLHAVIDPDGSEQRTVPEVPDVVLVDFTGTAQEDRPLRLTAWYEVRAMEVPDLTARPPVRAAILRVADRHHQLYLCVHHVMIDGLSFDLVLSEVATRYEGEVTGRPVALPAPVQYREHVAWERRREAEPAFQDSLRYWQEQYADGIPGLDLPSARVQPAAGRGRLGRVRHQVDADVAAQLPGQAASAGVTIFTVLLGAYGYLLHQVSGQDDLVIGVGFARRGYPGGERVVGNCAGAMPVRSRLRSGATVRHYLRDLQGTLIAAHEHPDFSISALRERVPLGDGAGGRTFTAAFNLDRTAGLPSPGGLRVSVAVAPRMFAKHDLVFDVLLAEREIRFSVDYNEDIIEPVAALAYARAYAHVLRRFVTGQDEWLSQVRLADGDVLNRLLSHETGPTVAATEPLTLTGLIERSASRSPGGLALSCAGEEITFAELNVRSDRLARYLVKLGAGPEHVVAVAAPLGVPLAVGIVATLKAGAACYLPDLTKPRDAHAVEVADAAPAIVVTVSDTAQLVTSRGAVRVVVDDPVTAQKIAAQGGAERAGQDLSHPPLPGHPACLCYLPDAAGQPAALVVSHAAIMNALRWRQEEVALSADDRVLLASAPGAGVLSLLWALGAGATAMLAPGGEQCDSVSLSRLIRQTRATVIQLGPTGALAGRVDAVRRVLYDNDLLAPWAVLQPAGVRSWNSSIYVLNRYLHPVPPWIIGEIHVAGAGLPREYRGRPGLTAERLVAAPFGQPGARMHRTGIQAYWTDNGELCPVDGTGFLAEPAMSGPAAQSEIEVALWALP
jgi:non-ribosomal peptide synthetase component F